MHAAFEFDLTGWHGCPATDVSLSLSSARYVSHAQKKHTHTQYKHHTNTRSTPARLALLRSKDTSVDAAEERR